VALLSLRTTPGELLLNLILQNIEYFRINCYAVRTKMNFSLVWYTYVGGGFGFAMVLAEVGLVCGDWPVVGSRRGPQMRPDVAACIATVSSTDIPLPSVTSVEGEYGSSWGPVVHGAGWPEGPSRCLVFLARICPWRSRLSYSWQDGGDRIGGLCT